MRTDFYECSKHTSYWRKKAFVAYPYASAALPIRGGYLLFESWSDYYKAKGDDTWRSHYSSQAGNYH